MWCSSPGTAGNYQRQADMAHQMHFEIAITQDEQRVLDGSVRLREPWEKFHGRCGR